MQSLLVSYICPWGAPSGARMRLGQVIKALMERGPLDLLLLRSSPPPPAPSDLPFRTIEVVSTPQSAGDASNAPDSYVRASCQVVVQRNAVGGILSRHWIRRANYDVVWYNRERIWLEVRGLISGSSIIDIDDLEDVLLDRWLRIGKTPSGLAAKASEVAAMKEDASWWRSSHRITGGEADLCVFASESDRRHFGPCRRSLVVQNTYDAPVEEGRLNRLGGLSEVLLQGLMTWPPNADAAAWLVEDIAPRIRATYPSLRVTLVGLPSRPVESLARYPYVRVTGQVADLTPYLQQTGAVVVPLRVASGSRIKILEAFAHRVPVVATSIAAEGLEVVDDIHLKLADSADGIARACIEVLTSSVKREALTRSAHQLFEERYRTRYAREALSSALDGVSS